MTTDHRQDRIRDEHCMIAVVDPDHRCRDIDGALRPGSTYAWCFEGKVQANHARERIEEMERHDEAEDPTLFDPAPVDLEAALAASLELTEARRRSAERHPSRSKSWSQSWRAGGR